MLAQASSCVVILYFVFFFSPSEKFIWSYKPNFGKSGAALFRTLTTHRALGGQCVALTHCRDQIGTLNHQSVIS